MERHHPEDYGKRKSYFIPPVTLLVGRNSQDQIGLNALIVESDPSINNLEAGQTAAALRQHTSTSYDIEHPASGREVLSTHKNRGMTWGGGDAIDFYSVLHNGGLSKLQALRIVTLFTYLTDKTSPEVNAAADEAHSDLLE